MYFLSDFTKVLSSLLDKILVFSMVIVSLTVFKYSNFPTLDLSARSKT